MNQLRVNIDDLDWDDYVYYYQDKPFIGIGFELFENGKIRTETEFLYGLYHGVSKEWFVNGQLEVEDAYNLGVKHGLCNSWFENGKKKSELEYELGVLIKEQIWDENGKVVKNFELKESDGNYEILLLNRQKEPQREKMIKEKLGKI